MKLNEALAVISARKSGGPRRVHFLVCGFEPLHLSTLLRASLIQRLPGDDIEVLTGVYGDLRGNLAIAAESGAVAAAVVVEWSDLDPRLGLRGTAGWSGDVKADITKETEQALMRLESAIARVAEKMPVAVAGPSLPLPPIGNTIRAQQSVIELELHSQLAAFLLRLARIRGVRVVSRATNERCLDAKMELLAGFPFTLAFASELASALTDVLWQRPPMKGLITDLDETLWSGIAGEAGSEGLTWHQEHHSQTHGIYQQMLAHLADCGVLLAVCSKNDPTVAEAALAREDLLLKPGSFFPVCANWEPKSQSVGRVLRTWNIAADSVVFIDDSPMELEEVKQAFPDITCLQFNGKDPQRVWSLLGELRDLFGKPVLTDDDRLRQVSLRSRAQLEEMGETAISPDFLRGLQGVVTLDWRLDPGDRRPLELINKTNQFNLNGRRLAEGEWQRLLAAPATVLQVVSYRDKFGPLGKIAVLVGSRSGATIRVSHWVMSCRAFSRRLEYHSLDALLRRPDVAQVEFAFAATERNGPLREFFKSLGVGPDSDGGVRIDRAAFTSRCGLLPHEVSEYQ
jgi:FkbH-like protein